MALDTQVPQWLVQQNQWQQEDASRSVQGLVQSWFEGQKLGIEKQEAQQRLAQGMLGMQQQKQALDLGAVKLNNTATDSKVIPAWLQEHPTWESRQDASWPAALTPEGESQLTQVRMRDAGSIQQKAAVAAVGDFAKRVDKLSAVDPATAGQFAPYIGKANPSPTILQALSVAEQAVALNKQNTIDQATADAQARGDVATTTINDKGVSTAYKPAPTNKLTGDEFPETMQLPNGSTVAWMPGGKTLHVIQADGKRNVYTPFQLQSIAKGLGDKDPIKKQINDFLSQSASKQISGGDNNSTSTTSFKVGNFTVTPK